MSDQLEFILRMKDLMSGMFPKVATTAQTSLGHVNGAVNQTQMNLNRLSAPVKINVDSSAVRRAHDDIAMVNDRMGMLGTTLAVGIGTGIERGVERAASFLKSELADVLTQGMQGSALKMQYQVLAGEQPGLKLYSEATKFIQDSVFGNEIYKDVQTMEAFGVKTKEVMPDIKMLGDVSMGNAERMQALTLAFSQTTAAGKLMGQDLLQYVNAGFNPLQSISEHTGKKISDLRDEMSDGKISAEQVRQAFIWATSEGGKFHNMLNKIAETPFGKKEAMMGNVDNAKLVLGTALLPSLNYFMDTMKPVVDDLPNNLMKLQPAIDSTIRGMADMVKWTANNTETLSKWFGVVKVGVEAYAAWKVGTVAMTAANWLWNASVAGAITETAAATTAMGLENAALATQGELVSALAVEYDALTVSMSGMAGMSEKAAAMAAAQRAFSLPINMTGAVAGNANATMLAGGFAAAASRAVIPVAVMYFAGEALGALLPKGENGETFSTMTGLSFGSMESYLLSLWTKSLRGAEPHGNLKGDPMHLATIKSMLPGVNGGMRGEYFNKEKPAKDAITDATDAITGGGKRQIIINLNKPLIGKQEYKVGTMKEATEISLRTLEEQVLIMLEGAARSVS